MASAPMDKVYDPQSVESRLYKEWMDKGYFHAQRDPDKKPFTIVIPPPNVTGQLHMGHALDNMMQDALIRFKRMQGYAALWLPGTDHASISTEMKVVEQLRGEGLNKRDLGREKFLERAWEWKRTYGGRIVEQLKRLGSSCDWQRERFTMDEGCNKAVVEVFNRLYEKGLIYRGNRIINWCPHCETSLSDVEVEYEEQASHLWHIRYPRVDGKGEIVVATTRPETILGDMAVAVHPEDERYADLIGKMVELPLCNRQIPVIADEYVEKDFGTGAVKITPAHDPNDFEVAMRHDLEVLRVIADNGTMNEKAGAYAGLDRMECRKKLVEDLQSAGYMVKIEDYTHNVGHCERCKTVVEPIASEQWFVKMEPLAGPAIAAAKNKDVQFVPERFERTYLNWMENIRDWCISRQLWWGHRIPAWYCQDCGEIIVARETPESCPKCASHNLKQDEDVLDTWFSSALWPFSTLGWPEETEDFKYFYPTDILVTGYDIIFFWVARMIFSALEQTGKAPFHHVIMHGIVRDSQGRKMSKSLGNGIDPLEVVDKYGADALRFSLATGNSAGNDMRFYWEKVESSRNFANKIWNAARFVMMNAEGKEIPEIDVSQLDAADQWILTRYNLAVQEVTDFLEKFDLGLAAAKIYDFIWSEFCDWYIELCKPRLQNGDAGVLGVLVHVLKGMLKLLHPFMPFLTEEIYQHLPGTQGSIMVSDWPRVDEVLSFPEEAARMEGVMELIRAVRNLRSEMNVSMGKRTSLTVLPQGDWGDALRAAEVYITRLAYASAVNFIADKGQVPDKSVSAVCAAGEVFIPLGELVDVDKELARLDKERQGLEKEVARAEGKLNNPGFVNKAPEKIVAEEREKLALNQDKLERLDERIASLQEMR
ncbi:MULTISPECIES: valine--tRNA ligase [unclassified Clostridium]|uniref:valine--tRNA ligase n=1 Tax=unclassified Clostridium TaxID=2614128 RepID=UPI001106A571|nr:MULTISPECIES: valine--tRNA ligase [unclassified Clostridium]